MCDGLAAYLPQDFDLAYRDSLESYSLREAGISALTRLAELQCALEEGMEVEVAYLEALAEA